MRVSCENALKRNTHTQIRVQAFASDRERERGTRRARARARVTLRVNSGQSIRAEKSGTHTACTNCSGTRQGHLFRATADRQNSWYKPSSSAFVTLVTGNGSVERAGCHQSCISASKDNSPAVASLGSCSKDRDARVRRVSVVPGLLLREIASCRFSRSVFLPAP